MSIRWKLSLIMAFVSMTLVAALYFGIQWSFERGFLSYVNQQQQAKLEQLASAIATDFGSEERWQLLKSDPRFWVRYLRHYGFPAGFGADAGIMQHRITLTYKDKPIAQSTFQEITKRPTQQAPFVLFDGDRTPLFPRRAFDFSQMIVAPITIDAQILGYIGFKPLDQTNSTGQLETIFVETQVNYFAAFAGLGAIISLIFSYFLAKRLTRPVEQITGKMQELVKGDYQQNVEVAGNDELASLGRAFNHTAQTLSQNRTSQQQWIADISHELRTPVAIMKGEIEAMVDGIRPKSEEQLQSLHQELGQLGGLINDLHQLSTSDQGNMSYKMEPTDVLDLLIHVEQSSEIEREAHGIGFELITKGKPADLMLDSQRFSQLLKNLMQNNIRYSGDGSQVTVNVIFNHHHVDIYWADNGPGVNEASLEKLFDRLYREESSRNRATGGSGLGLAICKNIVEAHQGTIKAEAVDPSGLCFHITLPIIKSNS